MKSKRDTSFLIAGHVPFNLCEGRPPSLESYLFFHRWTPFTITHIGLPEYQHAVLINGALISCGELSRRIETLFLTGSETLLCTGISDPLSSFNSNVPSSKIVSVASIDFGIFSPPFFCWFQPLSITINVESSRTPLVLFLPIRIRMPMLF